MAQQMDDVIFVAPDQHAVLVGDEAGGIDPEGVLGRIDAENAAAVLKRPEQLEGRHRHLDVEEVHKLDGAVSSIQRPCHVNR